MTELKDLISRDFETRKSAFESLKGDAYRICYKRLGQKFPQEIDDVVMETMTDIFEKTDEVHTNEGLAKLTMSIADNKAIDCWRKQMTKKRGEGEVESLDATVKDDEGKEKPVHEPAAEMPHINNLDVEKIRDIIETLQAELKSEHKQALNDYFIEELSYEEISMKRNWPLGSVGVYVKRGLQAMRKQRLKYPQLTKEAAQYIITMLLA